RRRHDLAVLRALGADRRWMTSILHWQATVLAAVVTVLAIPLGVALGRIVYATYIERIGARADVSMPFALLGLILVTFVVLGNLAALAPARRARHELPGRVLIEE
ncbi:MAG: FtsX-like permease family protein, partial [Acidimicrobiales bacterium]